MPPLLSSSFVDLSQENFVQGLTIKALAQIWGGGGGGEIA